jgi:hypothetical protein
VKRKAREGGALTVEQLYELASWFPACANRLVLLAGNGRCAAAGVV